MEQVSGKQGRAQHGLTAAAGKKNTLVDAFMSLSALINILTVSRGYAQQVYEV